MDETVNQGTEQTANAPERTFTQAEMDAIIGDRLARERAKYADYDEVKAKAAQYDAAQEAGKSELDKAREQAEAYKAKAAALEKQAGAREARDKVSAATGVPANLLTGETEEACRAQAEALLAWHGAQPYPSLRDAGEARTSGGGGATRDQFAGWFDQAMRNV